MCDEKMDILNRIAGRITNYIKNIGVEPCDLCKYSNDYRGKCIAYSWDVTYFPPSLSGELGIWNFSLYHHKKEIWYIAKDGTIVDIIIAAYENLISGEWKKYAKETLKEKGDSLKKKEI